MLLRQLLRCVLQATLRLGRKGSVRKGGEGLGVGRGGALVKRHVQRCALQASMRLGGRGSVHKGGGGLGVGWGVMLLLR